MNIEIANRLVQLRKQHGLSQEELAARLGLSRQAVSKWERAEASPDTDNLILLSRIYGVSIDELLRTEDPIPEPEPEKGVKAAINGKPVRLHARDGSAPVPSCRWMRTVRLHTRDGFYFSVGDDDDEDVEENCDDRDADKDDAPKPFLKAFPYPVFVALLYLCFGFAFDLWHPGWLVFPTILIYYPIVNWIYGSRRHSFWHAFPYTMIVITAFLALGCIWGLWNPAWALFLTIPVYYPIAHNVDRHYCAKRKENEA